MLCRESLVLCHVYRHDIAVLEGQTEGQTEERWKKRSCNAVTIVNFIVRGRQDSIISIPLPRQHSV